MSMSRTASRPWPTPRLPPNWLAATRCVGDLQSRQSSRQRDRRSTLTTPRRRATDGKACSVIIAAHNAADVLSVQLDALARQEGDIALEVIVVANQCSDGTVALVERYQRAGDYRHDLRVIRADERAAATYARNQGVEIASYPMLLVCDADDIVWPTWSHELYLSLLDADLVGGATVRWNPHDHPDPASIQHLEISFAGEVRYDFLPAVVGANHAFRRSIWDKIGGYDESFVNATDVDFAWRAQLAGARFASNEKALVYYRDRPTVHGEYVRHRAYGRADAQLFRKFRKYGMPKPRRLRRRPSVRYVHQLVTAYRLLTPDGRRTWIGHLGKNVGRLQGSLKHHVLYL